MAVIAAGHVEQLRAQADRDSLTGMLNRRAFMRELGTEIERSLRYGRRFVLALCDLDEFKRINDTDGHPAGDRALEGVAALLERTIRASDFAFRIGGDEFALLLPETDADEAQRGGRADRGRAGGRQRARRRAWASASAWRSSRSTARRPRSSSAAPTRRSTRPSARTTTCTSRRAPPERSYTRGRGGPRTRRRRHLERRALHALRRAARRRAPRRAAAPGRRHRHRHHRRRLRRGRGRRAARPRAARASPRDAYCLVGADRATTSTRASARARRASRASPTRACAAPTATRTTCGWRPSAALRALGVDALRPAAAAQPRPHRLHERGGVGGDGGAARRRA